MTAEKGEAPKREEFCAAAGVTRVYVEKLFGSYTKLIDASGIPQKNTIQATNPINLHKLEKQYKALCSRKEQIQGFFRHTIDLAELFQRAGNPEVLKMSGMPDTHVKFRDHQAVECYLKFLDWYKPDIHLIFGDFADCEGISHWPSDSLEPRRLVPEMKEARLLLQQICDKTPTASTRIYLEGNHEDWIDQGLKRMPELFEGLEDLGIEINVKRLLNLESYGYELFPVNHLVQIGHAHFTHGIYTGTAHAKKHLDVFKTNIYYGHLHDRQVHTQTSIYGKMEAASQGCLSRLDAKFLKGKPNNWEHGHGVWEFFRDGSYVHYYVPIINGKSSFAGKVFTA